VIKIPAQEMTDFALFLKEDKIGSRGSLSKRSVSAYEKKHGKLTPNILQENISSILSECIITEKELFKKIDYEIRSSWAELVMDCDERKSRFPTISKIVEKARTVMADDEKTNDEKVAMITKEFTQINDGLSMSQKNSAKSRSGSAFEYYLEHFFGILEIRYDRQVKISTGEVLDLVFPDKKTVQSNPKDCIMMECQTTLKDRFRLSLGKGQALAGIRKFIATATGANLITPSDHNDLNFGKINEISEKQYKLVTLKQVSERWNSPSVISFEDFINDQRIERKVWRKKKS